MRRAGSLAVLAAMSATTAVVSTDRYAAAIEPCDGHPATIVGTEGNDVLTGTDRQDVIVALGGNDTIIADDGDDFVCDGAGDDSVFGGSGRDEVLARSTAIP